MKFPRIILESTWTLKMTITFKQYPLKSRRKRSIFKKDNLISKKLNLNSRMKFSRIVSNGQ